ncbi:hypothetical protein AMATHDRAFT_131492, partial [Amanita thiersii Skay4041]
ALCAALFSRGLQIYHWTFILPTSTEDATKFHAVIGAESWLYLRDEHFLSKSRHACVVVQLAAPDTCTADELDNILKDVPLQTPEGEDEIFTCRVWLRAAAGMLHEHGIINCPNPKELEEELKELAHANNQDSLEGRGYVFHKS